ncbi:MAG: hypothetical protein ACR2FF_03810 [Mycobacteriales bacterium]|nr:MAG: hypothetical protein DLM56_06310 [Pseudonocardiales bacterium]
MATVSALPSSGSVFFDARDDGRSMRLSWHGEASIFVVSLWRGDECAGTFRLPIAEVPRLIHAMTSALALPPRWAVAEPAV